MGEVPPPFYISRPPHDPSPYDPTPDPTSRWINACPGARRPPPEHAFIHPEVGLGWGRRGRPWGALKFILRMYNNKANTPVNDLTRLIKPPRFSEGNLVIYNAKRTFGDLSKNTKFGKEQKTIS